MTARTMLFLLLCLLTALTACSSLTAPKASQPPATTSAAAATATQSAFAAQPAPVAQAAPAPATAPATATALPTEDTNISGIVADFTECRRREGVLSVKIRFRNTSSAGVHVGLISGRNYEAWYVTAANKKYFMLKDSEGAYLTPPADMFGGLGVDIAPGQQYTWWAKFPAPPAEIRKITFMSPVAPPFEDIPVTDQ